MLSLKSLASAWKFRKTPAAPAFGKNASLLELARIRSIEDEIIASLTASQLKTILDEAAEGECGEQAKMIQGMIEKDGILNAHFETRKMAVLACDMKLIRGDGELYEPMDPRYTEVWTMLENAGLYKLCAHLLDSTPQGYAASVTDWDAGGKAILGWRHIHPTNVKFDLEGNPALWTIANDKDAEPFAAWHPNQFVLHTYDAKADIPCKNGLGRSLAWLFFFKHLARKSWVRFVEKFGVPFLIAQISDADFGNQTQRDLIVANLRKLASDGAAVCTEASKVEAVSVAGNHNRIHEEFIRRIDEAYAMAILGQVGSSQGEAGRLGNNEMQQDVRQDRKEADALMLMRTINDQIIRPLWTFLHGENAKDCPQFVMDYTVPKDKQRLADAVQKLYACGLKPNPVEMSFIFGFNVEEFTPETPPKPVGGGGDAKTPQPTSAR